MTEPVPFPTLPIADDSIDQTALDAEGISAFIVVTPESGRMLQFLEGATDAQFQDALGLLGLTDVTQEAVDQARLDLTNQWLTVKSCLDALPPTIEGLGEDPYASARARLQGEVDTAWQAVSDAGGPL